jgi:probable phosphoglycerate mutase
MSGRLVLVRHGQSHANVDKRLDTRPPVAELTPLGRDQARAFAREATSVPGLLLHSVATRAAQTAAEIGDALGVSAREVLGIHEVQVGDLENRNGAGSRAIGTCRCPAGKTPIRCSTATCRCWTS